MKLIIWTIAFTMCAASSFSQSIEEKIVVKNINFIHDFGIAEEGLTETSFKANIFIYKELLPSKIETITLVTLALETSKNGKSSIDTTYTELKVLKHLTSHLYSTLTIEIEKDILNPTFQSVRYFQWQADVPLLQHIEKNSYGNIVFENYTYDGLAFGTEKYMNKDEEYIEENMLNGLKHGRSILQRNGEFILDETYFLGQKYGMKVEKFENGNIKSELFFFNDKEEGYGATYYTNGNKLNDLNYKAGVIHGSVAKYYENGQVMFKTTYNNGATHGEYTKYFESGALFAKANFVNGTLHGKYKDYYESGKVKSKGTYENGVKAEGWKDYDESGNEIK
jgi:antitoxin component YwqK of YwqJK toxin-antitoxin module